MNKDQVKGRMNIAGKAQQKTGEITGSEKQQIKGTQKQAEGKIEKSAGDAEEALKDANKHSKP